MDQSTRSFKITQLFDLTIKKSEMIARITSGWTITRALYLVLGTFVIVQSTLNQQWLGVLFGTYFASMGLFGFGCAVGNCFRGRCEVPAKSSMKAMTTDIEVEK